MPECKRCGSSQIVKSGKIRKEQKQRYLCKTCGCNFVEGDSRREDSAALKALCILLSALGKGSYQKIGNLVKRDRAQIYRWAQEAGLGKMKPDAYTGLISLENTDELKRYMQNTDEFFGSDEPLLLAGGDVSDDISVVVIAQRRRK